MEKYPDPEKPKKENPKILPKIKPTILIPQSSYKENPTYLPLTSGLGDKQNHQYLPILPDIHAINPTDLEIQGKTYPLSSTKTPEINPANQIISHIETLEHINPKILEKPQETKSFDKTPSISEFLPNYPEMLSSISGKIEEFQQGIIQEERLEPDITLADYTAAYRRLNEERNKPWKLNPRDIADFYLLAQFIGRHKTPSDHQEDSTYLAINQAKARVSEIGKKLLIALAHEQLDEYDRFTLIDSTKLSDELKAKLDAYYADRPTTTNGKASTQEKMNRFLSDFQQRISQDSTAARNEIFEDTEMFKTALEILESQQGGPWKTMAAAMSTLLDSSAPLGNFIKKLFPADVDPEIVTKAEQDIAEQREVFLIDRLINYVHNTGRMSSRVTNDFPRSASLLVVHGMPEHDQYLLYHSSFAHSSGTLSSLLRKDLSDGVDRDLIGDLTTLVKTNKLPREYKYALLLEFNNPSLNEAIKSTSSEDLSPSRIYNLLQRISHHDGRSRGRLKPDN